MHKPNAILSILMHNKCISKIGLWIKYVLIMDKKYVFYICEKDAFLLLVHYAYFKCIFCMHFLIAFFMEIKFGY